MHLIREAMRSRADNLRDELFPDYYMEVHGILMSNDNVRFILKEMDARLHCSMVRDNFYFKHIECNETVEGDTLSCDSCQSQLTYLQRKCIDTIRMRTEGVTHEKKNNKYLYNSPSLISRKVDRLAQNAKKEVVKRSKAKAKAILEIIMDKEGVNLSASDLEDVFSDNLHDLANKFFNREKVSQDNLARYLFQ